MWKIRKIVKKGKYLYAVVPEHPRATKNGYVLQHRIVMENHLERLLDPKEVVHHINEDGHDNRIDNLELLPSNSIHAKIHGQEKGSASVELKCPWCKSIFIKRRGITHLIACRGSSKYTCCSNKCSGSFGRMIQLKGITTEVERAISENIVRELRIYSHDNPEETATTGSVETTRALPETAKI